jgi:hypothetical protein
MYSINQSTGALTSITTAIASGTHPNGVAVDPTGRFVYVANSTGNTVSMYSINNFSAGSAFFAGNVGIGTTTPNAKLDIMGDVRFEGTSTLVSASIGGGALLAGACATATSSIDSSYSTSTTAVVMTPQTYPGDGVFWHAYISAVGVLTEKVCEAVAGTPTASAYVIKLVK